MADIDVHCGNCDALLEAEFKRYGQTSTALIVEPCKDCMDQAKADGYESGKEDADGA